MYISNHSGLEGRVNNYSPSSCSNSCYSGRSCSPTYSKLEVKASSETVIDYMQACTSGPINLDKPLEVMRSAIHKAYSNGKQGYDSLRKGYSAGSYSGSSYNNKKFMPQIVEIFKPESFLSNKRHPVQFIGDAAEISSMISEAFTKTTGIYFPADIVIRVCSEEQMKEANKEWQPNVAGFCFNRKGFGISEIFVLRGDMDRVMLTIGHEIGHCLSMPLQDAKDEEAKAFAFSIAWALKIKEANIGGLAMNIDMNPAKNGIHDTALSFVAGMISKGEEALDIYRKLAKKEISMEDVCLAS